jgi:glycine/D-amino acid oxidase-like deaminating enzyme
VILGEPWDVIVVGAGICGLATAYELAKGGARVLVLEGAGVGGGQSAGLARIFRIAHADARLCALALEARDGWRRWTEELGAGRLVGDEGLVWAGPDAGGPVASAMDAAGAGIRHVGRDEIAHLLPDVAPDHPWDAGIVDPLGGAIRVRRTLDALAARLAVRRAEVLAADDHGDAAVVRLAGGELLRAGHVVLCAGTATPQLAATAGIALVARFTHHVRLTYARRSAAPTACLIAGDGYGLPLGGTGLWALGLDDPDGPAPWRTSDGDAFAAAVRRQHAEWVPRHLTGLEPEPVGEIRCVAAAAPWLIGEDGFAAARAGRVVAFTGGNLMKFGPLIGDRLARTVRDPDGVHPDLRPHALALGAPR